MVKYILKAKQQSPSKASLRIIQFRKVQYDKLLGRNSMMLSRHIRKIQFTESVTR